MHLKKSCRSQVAKIKAISYATGKCKYPERLKNLLDLNQKQFIVIQLDSIESNVVLQFKSKYNHKKTAPH